MTETVQRSRRSLEATLEDVRIVGLPYSTLIDTAANQVVVSVRPRDVEIASASLAKFLDSGALVIRVTDELPAPVGEIYGGVNLDAFCGGLSGTAGWSVYRTSNPTLHGILTAGHLADCLKAGGVATTFVAGATSGNTDGQWHTTTFTEVPKFLINDDGGTRTVNYMKPYSAMVEGQVVCKYGRTTGYQCGTIEAKGVDPDGSGPLNAVFVRVQKCSGSIIADSGDSGGPVFNGTTAYGIVTHKGVTSSVPTRCSSTR